MKTLEEKIEVMQYCLNHGKIIMDGNLWQLREPPNFNWEEHDYSIYEEPKTKPSINWEHVNSEYKYMATDSGGDTYLYSMKPTQDEYNTWFALGEARLADGFASFKEGTCDWKDSLVERPE